MIFTVDGSSERTPDLFETSVWSRRAVNVEGEHRVVVAFPEPERSVVSGRGSREGPRVSRSVGVTRRCGRARSSRHRGIAAGKLLVGLLDNDFERCRTGVGPRGEDNVAGGRGLKSCLRGG